MIAAPGVYCSRQPSSSNSTRLPFQRICLSCAAVSPSASPKLIALVAGSPVMVSRAPSAHVSAELSLTRIFDPAASLID